MPSSPTTAAPSSSATVNILDLASAAVACTVTASRSIRNIADKKNTRLKHDGSFVTDADFAAQGVIVQALQSVSPDIRIVGEESPEEMASHIGEHTVMDDFVLQRTRREIRLRYNNRNGNVEDTCTPPLAPRPLGVKDETEENNTDGGDDEQPIDYSTKDPPDVTVDASRVSVFVDPLDGTSSYARGDTEVVSILIAIILDNIPWFGVVGKPFGYRSRTQILDTGCVAIYGGPIIKGVFIAGGDAVLKRERSNSVEDPPRAVISSSRSQGIVHDFCVHLGSKGLIHPDPMHISGAGEKSLRLILQQENEGLWFFPKSGTSLWDVAASDALLRALGGKLTDKSGNEMDYSKTREESENINGVVACIDAELHAECIRLFNEEGDWSSRR